MSPIAALAGAALAAGLLMCIAAALPSRRRPADRPPRDDWRRLATRRLSDRRAADLRLAGIDPAAHLAHQALSGAAGLLAGTAIAAQWASAAPAATAAVAACTAAGWLLPAQAARDTARQRRRDLQHTVSAWIALTAQQVNAGAEPAQAMLRAAHANSTLPWRTLARRLHATQNDTRPAADGLGDLAESYRLDGLDETLSALTLASRRGTRLADAVLTAAHNQWQRRIAAERETAQRHNQIIALPAAASALALAAILIYPPLVSLTGGITATAP